MKKKIDFITNSSSSSFILPDSIKDTKDVAKQMVDIIFKEWKEYNRVNKKYEKEIYNNIKKLDKNENIMIPFSCNYETFIYRLENGKIFVDTCNNHDYNWETMDIVEFNPDDYDEDKEKEKDKMLFVNIETCVKDTRKNLLKIAYKDFEGRYLKK